MDRRANSVVLTIVLSFVLLACAEWGALDDGGDDLTGEPVDTPDTGVGAESATGEPEQEGSSAEAMRLDPVLARPGQTVELWFPQGSERGVGYLLEEELDGEWVPRYRLTSAPEDYLINEPFWEPVEQEGGWDEIAVDGPGPDPVRVPQGARAGRYRLCTANAPAGTFCAVLEITE